MPHSRSENFAFLTDGLARILKNTAQSDAIRPSQRAVLETFIHNPTKYETGIFDLATAFGKTRIMATLADAFLKNTSAPIIVVEPTQELVKQISSELSDYFHAPRRVGQFYAEKKDLKTPVIVTTYNSLEQLTTRIDPQKVGLVLLDEGHHAVSDKRMEIVRSFTNACQYGLTATPDYSEDRSLRNLLNHTIARVNIVQGIQDGILSPFANLLLLSKFEIDLSGIKKNGLSEYDTDEYHKAFTKALSPVQLENTDTTNWQTAHQKVASEIALFYKNLSAQKKHCLINCHSQEEAQIQADEINKVFGKKVAGVWTSDTRNSSDLEDFEKGRLSALCQVSMLQEGYDFPALDLCINYPTASWVRATQRGGRTLRLDPDNPQKQATIVDIVFAFPGTKNPYTSARKNGQVLYSDVVKAVCVAHKKTPQKHGTKSPPLPEIPSISLNCFQVISDVHSLLGLKRQDQQVQVAEYVPQKEDGMLSPRELALSGGTPSKYEQIFEMIFRDQDLNTCFDSENKPFQLIQRVRSSGSDILCLSNHPEAMDFFKEICSQHYKCRYDGYIPLEEYAKGHYLPLTELRRLAEKIKEYKLSLYNDYHEHALVYKGTRKGNESKLFLNDSPEARLELKSYMDLIDLMERIPLKPNNMMDLSVFLRRTGLDMYSVSPVIKKALLNNLTYRNDNSEDKPLVQFYTNDQEEIGICVPDDFKAQYALLKLCGFKFLSIDSSKVIQTEREWQVFHETKLMHNHSLGDLAELYNVPFFRVSLLNRRVIRRCLDLLYTNFGENSEVPKALCIRTPDHNYLITEDQLRSSTDSSWVPNLSFVRFKRILQSDYLHRHRREMEHY